MPGSVLVPKSGVWVGSGALLTSASELEVGLAVSELTGVLVSSIAGVDSRAGLVSSNNATVLASCNIPPLDTYPCKLDFCSTDERSAVRICDIL